MFKILMDESLIDKIEILTSEKGKLLERLESAERDKKNHADEIVKELREIMQKALTESDIIREKLETKVEMYEKMLGKFNFNINKEVK